MKISYFFLLTVYAGSVYAAPPTLDGSTYNNDAGYIVPAPSNQILDSLYKLQHEIVQIKGKVTEQSRAITDLKVRQDRLENLRVTAPSGYGPQPAVFSNSLAPTSAYDTAKVLPGEKNHYEYAYSVFRNGRYDQAIAEFQSIIKTYPHGEYADNSQYWTGEALLKKGNKLAAMRAFDGVIRLYPQSAKVPDALLKLGMTQLSIGNKLKAREYLDYLIASYPGTPSANVAYTKRLQAGL